MNRIKEYLTELYPQCADQVYAGIEKLTQKWKPQINAKYRRIDKRDVMLITYGDGIWKEGEPPLVTLGKFLREELNGTVNCVHLLPMFPYTSDDGFSVTDFRQINSELGTWEDVLRLREDFDLMFDAVINHVSKSGEYFNEYCKGNEKYENYFIEAEEGEDYGNVTRPRTSPLFTEYETARGKKKFWTTFSEDQVDLNYKNPEVLLEILDVLFLYVEKGARFIRLDAIGFAWKETKTTCMHLPRTHTLIKLIRAVLEQCAAGVTIVTETNVPHEDNISYFGNGHDEAGMVYQFPLPPLTLYSYLSGSAEYLSKWADSLETISEDVTYFNFLASHDGIGMRPVEQLLNDAQREMMVKEVQRRGGKISYRSLPDGGKVPYELNINYLDAVAGDEREQELVVRKYMGSQCVLLSVMGMPGIYYHSLLGSRNCYKDYEKSGINRRINREKLEAGELVRQLHDESSLRHQILSAYRTLLEIRKTRPEFEPNSPQKVVYYDERVFSIIRGGDAEKLLVLVNVSKDMIDLEIGMSGRELLSGKQVAGQIELGPYEYMWISLEGNGENE